MVVVGSAIRAEWVSAEAREAIVRLTEDANDLAGQLRGVLVTDGASAARVTELLTLAATTQKRVEEARRSITDPLKHQAKLIEDAVRPVVQALDALVTVGKTKVLSWQRAEVERIRLAREAQEKAEAEARRKAVEQAAVEQRPVAMPEPLPPVQEVPRGVRTDYGTASLTQTWDFEVVDAALLPAAFLIPNEQAIRGAVRGGARSIPGVRIFQKDGVAVRAR